MKNSKQFYPLLDVVENGSGPSIVPWAMSFMAGLVRNEKKAGKKPEKTSFLGFGSLVK